MRRRLRGVHMSPVDLLRRLPVSPLSLLKRGAYAVAALAALACSVPASAQQQNNNTYLRETHGSWEIRCVASTSECFMSHAHLNDQGQPDVIMTIVKAPPGQTDSTGATISALAEIAVPLDVFLPAGVSMTIDTGQVRTAPYERCVPRGCVVRSPVNDAMLNELKFGYNALMRVMVTQQNPVQINMSLSGFSAAFGAL